MHERKVNDQDKTINRYSGLDFIIFDASDFNPRGSLRNKSQITPPYPLSKIPSNFKSVQDVIDYVLERNAESDLERVLLTISGKNRQEEVVFHPLSRTKPEEFSNGLTLNCLRASFSHTVKQKDDGDIFSKGDKVAIIKRKNEPDYLLVVLLSLGKYIYIGSKVDEDKIKKYSNERAVRSHQSAQQYHKKGGVDETEKPFEIEDLEESHLREAKDDGKRKNYPKETENFFNRMRQADLDVENLLINNMDLMVPISESVKRLAKRKGRDYVRNALTNLRCGNWDASFDEMQDDINFEKRDNGLGLSCQEIEKGFNLLLKAEKYYFEAILDFPWNKVGPEPFDTLINVFWFRFNFIGLRFKWESRNSMMKSIHLEVYKEAQIQRILEWVWLKKGYKCAHLKELKELKIKYNPKRVAKDMGPLYKFMSSDELHERIVSAQKRFRPSGLTLLLWKTLKWASASEWRAGGSMMTSDFRYEDPELWDEHFADPEWKSIGDFQGRLILPGETTSTPLPHLKFEKGGRLGQLEKLIAFNYESNGDELSLADINLEKQRKLREIPLKSFKSAAQDFFSVVSHLTFKELMTKIERLELRQKAIVLHRLGYDVPAKESGIANNFEDVGIDSFRPVKFVINTCFSGKANLYYRELRAITRLLQS